MQEKSSVETWPPRVRLGMIALNFLPLVHLMVIGLSFAWAEGGWRVAAPLLILFVAPPLLVRALLAIFPISGGTHTTGSRAFFVWWATAQLQMIFCRLPLFEEALRLVPGLYSLWLRLWGARVGRLTFWAPGLRILDRPFLQIGDDVVFGTGARLNAHVIATDDNRCPILHLAPIHIGDRCRIGGYALLTAGAVIEPDSDVHACALLPPFTIWRQGRRTKPAVMP